eukprot:1157739-Pelagomonas_calceolata.AAC.2
MWSTTHLCVRAAWRNLNACWVGGQLGPLGEVRIAGVGRHCSSLHKGGGDQGRKNDKKGQKHAMQQG